MTTDVTANKHRNSPTSIRANNKISKSKAAWQFMCIEYIRRSGTATLKELCAHYNKTPNQISGRLSELRFAGRIEKTGETRESCAVYRLA